MKLHKLKSQQFLNANIDEVWDYFSSPKNLNKITPPDFKFNILSDDADEKIYPGKIIQYKVSPVKILPPMKWVTEISQAIDKKLFIDEQRFGPYKFWHHKHIFEEKEGKVLMTDIVHYSVGYGFIGEIAHKLFIKKKLNQVFDYRFKKVEEIFG